MDLVHSSFISTAGVLFIRILIRYGTHSFPLSENRLDKIFTCLIGTLDALIFIHKDCFVSKEKPRLRVNHSKQLYKQHPNSFVDPVIFEGQFNLDCDSSDAGLRAEVCSLQRLPQAPHELNVDAFFSVPFDTLDGNLFKKLRDEVRDYLEAYRCALKSILMGENTIPRCLTTYYFQHNERLIRVFYPPFCRDEACLREKMHESMCVETIIRLFISCDLMLIYVSMLCIHYLL